MRKLERDKNGVTLSPPDVDPFFNKRRTSKGMIPLITQVRSYELITPLFGGGVDAGVADPVTIIRGAGIRGHLRFWWRASRGGCFGGSLSLMQKMEGQIWGTASIVRNPSPSQVQVKVEITNRGQEKQPFTSRTSADPDWQALAYAAFPLQGDSKRQPGKVLEGVTFEITLTFPQSKQADVEAALWAWETFGGIGGRTRRGFGALKLISVDQKPVAALDKNNAAAEIKKGLKMHVVSGTWPSGVPHLECNLSPKITPGQHSVKNAWEYLIRRLKRFRQARNPGTAPGQPGRSLWPEPDEIRRLTGRRCSKHANVLSTVRKFPRAAFGLPILFHFKDERAGDPEDTTLQGIDDYERLASPLILRPLACAGGGAVGLALILKGTDVTSMPGGLILKDAPGNPTVHASLISSEAGLIKPLGGKVDVLQAFLNTL